LLGWGEAPLVFCNIFHFTPASSSWLDQVERWFAEITRRQMRRGSFSSVHELEKSIYEYLAAWNEKSQPFVWRATADILLDKVRSGKELYVTEHQTGGTSRQSLSFQNASRSPRRISFQDQNARKKKR
jgi:hypothetical protein